MKSRWTIYLLLAAVAAVWGVVAWRILAPPNPDLPSGLSTPSAPSAPLRVADTLGLNYPDPFLKGASEPKPVARPAVRRLPPAKRAAPPRERIPFAHLGTVTAAGRSLHILTVGKEQYELSEGDTADGWRLAKADRDSLYLEREGVTYGVKRCE